MPLFQAPAVIVDPAVLKANAVAIMEARLPGWSAQSGSVEDVVFDAWSFAAAEQNEVLQEVLEGVYRGLGSLVNVPPLEPVPATGLAAVTVKDTAGYTIKAGELVIGVYTTNGELLGFRAVADLTVAPGASAGNVTVEAEEPGELGNSLGGVAQLITAPAFVTGVTLGTTGGGAEAETDAAYLDRLTEQLALQKPGPVLASDAAALARSMPKVGRAVAVDNLKPGESDATAEPYPTPSGAESTTAEKTVTVACTHIDGTPCTLAEREVVQKALAAKREPNFLFYVVKPHYWEIASEAAVFAWPGETLATVKANVEAAIKAFLSPAKWATDPTGDASRWTNDPTVRRSELYAAIMAVPGVRYVTTLKIAKQGAALAEADVTIEPASKVPALPQPGSTLTVTVTATT